MRQMIRRTPSCCYQSGPRAKAWRDDSDTLHANLVVSESAYDGLGRRIVKAVQNSADLDSTYHYYYNPGGIRVGFSMEVPALLWVS